MWGWYVVEPKSVSHRESRVACRNIANIWSIKNIGIFVRVGKQYIIFMSAKII